LKSQVAQRRFELRLHCMVGSSVFCLGMAHHFEGFCIQLLLCEKLFKKFQSLMNFSSESKTTDLQFSPQDSSVTM
jgi:hypothetical protein